MADKVKKQREKDHGLWIPNKILNIPRNDIKELGKMVFAHIYSFGKKGCWQSNNTIAKMFQVSDRAITKVISDMKEADLVHIKNPKGYFRTIWAKNHPDVIKAVKVWHTSGKDRKKLLSKLAENGKMTTQNIEAGLGKEHPTTNKGTKKETKAVTLPLPAGGQASQLLKDRQSEYIVDIGKFASGFGKPPKTTMSTAKFEQQRQINLKRLKNS